MALGHRLNRRLERNGVVAKNAAENSVEGLAARIERSLRQDIVCGRLADGERLRQDHLAARFGSTAAPVREALRRLENQHLVESRPRRGVIVRPIEPEDAVETAEMRAALEGVAIDRATAAPAAEDAEAARKALRRAERSRSVAEWVAANRAFHLALYRGAGRPRLLAAIEDLWLTSDRHLHRVWAQVAGYADRSQREHVEILEAYEAGDRRRAQRLLQAHIMAAGQTLKTLLTEGAKQA